MVARSFAKHESASLCMDFVKSRFIRMESVPAARFIGHYMQYVTSAKVFETCLWGRLAKNAFLCLRLKEQDIEYEENDYADAVVDAFRTGHFFEGNR